MDSVLVVGGHGFVGAHVCNDLAEAGYRVTAFDTDTLRPGTTLAPELTSIIGSVEHRSDLSAAITQVQADTVVSLAAYGAGKLGLLRSGDADPDRALAVNVGGLRNVLEAARAGGVSRIVWTSSLVVYGSAQMYSDRAVDEHAAPRPQSHYALTKSMAELLARQYRDGYAMTVTALRLPLVWGPGLWYEGVAASMRELCSAAGAGRALRISASGQQFDMCYVADVARAILATLRSPHPLRPEYNLVGFRAGLGDFVAALSRRFPAWECHIDWQDAMLTYPAADAGALQRDLGFSAAFGLEQALDAFLRNATVAAAQ